MPDAPTPDPSPATIVRLRSAGNGETVTMLDRAADALEAQGARITELEAHNRRLAGTMTGDTAVDLRVLYAYELGVADGRTT